MVIKLVALFQIISNENGEDSIRQLALEAVVTLAETAPGMIRKQKSVIPIISKLTFYSTNFFYLYLEMVLRILTCCSTKIINVGLIEVLQ